MTPRSPLVVDSPHSGRDYPADFGFSCPFFQLRRTEDFCVDELTNVAVDAGATFIAADVPRAYIDFNRAEDDIDPALLSTPWPFPLNPTDRTRLGLGLVRRMCAAGLPVYDAPLPPSAVAHRIARYYRPYHGQIMAAMDAAQACYGVAYLIDCHSMPDRAGPDVTPRPDFVLGNLSGQSCNADFMHLVRDHLQALGYSVALNDPYQGVEIVRRHGNPQQGRQALQLEINRRLYMDESALMKHQGFAALRDDLRRLFMRIVQDITPAQILAAE
ncbi:MAG: N-formylglutamate amidohydrolase [Alphaproteobacteria bacterium]|nr:N-formylglutamate amidohydrolase [Alphaproteobacteria bacterium]MBV8548054.1 N-formylglutamate amidohydrolase [Alphaproteobacteria bacterium]